MTEQELKQEKQAVNAYVSTLLSLDNPFSDKIELLPDSLADKARKYFDCNRLLTDNNRTITYSATEIRELKDRCRLAFQDYNAGLTALLGRHGYTFGQPDSLQKNLNRRMDDLVEDYRTREGVEAEPLLVDYTYRTPASQIVPNVAEYNEGTLQLYGHALMLDKGEPAYILPGGMDALRDRFAAQYPGDPMQITQIRNIYGATYEVRITEELTRLETIEAGSREEAEDKLGKMISDDVIVLDADDYVGASIGPLTADNGAYIGEDRPYFEAGPDGIYTVRVSEFLETTIAQEGTCRVDAEQRVLNAYMDQDLVLDADDYTCREIVASNRITDNRLHEPKPISPVSMEDMQRLIHEEGPRKMHIRFGDESVMGLVNLESATFGSMKGVFGSQEMGIQHPLPQGTLRVEGEFCAADYGEIWPDLDYYGDNKDYDRRIDWKTNAFTHYCYWHPEFDGGRMAVFLNEGMKDKLRIEGVPFREAIRLIKERQITDDRQFKEAAADYCRQHGLKSSPDPDGKIKVPLTETERISDVSVIMMGTKGPHIRCRIDDIQQSAKPVDERDAAVLNSGQVTREKLVLKYFKGELDVNAEQERQRFMHR